jgi:hypothetical protein
VIDRDKNKLYVDGELVYEHPERTFSCGCALFIFDSNQKGTPLKKSASMKLYYLEIYDNGSLVRSFIPCVRNSDSQIGLYDIVNGVFYQNQGTGSFTYGK